MKDPVMTEELFIETPPFQNLCAMPEHLLKETKLKILRALTPEQRMDATTGLLALYQDYGRVDEAIMAIKDVLKIHEFEREHASRLFFYLGQLSEQKRDFRKALEYYLKSIHIGSQEKHLKYYQNNNAGFCLNYLMEFKAARRFCMKATKISPKYYNAWKNLGVSFEHLGMIFDAATCYARSQWLEPSDPRARKHLDRLIFRNPHLFPVSSN